jgi:hypothetical protein
MADVKITALAVLTAADPINDAIPIVDVSDNTMAASGTTKRISVNNILSSSPTASGALTVTGLVTAGSATITGDLTVRTNKLAVTSTGVGFGTTSPNASFQATLSGLYGLRIQSADTNNSALNIGNDPTSGYAFVDATKTGSGSFLPLRFSTSDNERYRIAIDGVSTWSVAGTTAMTLNSTGLGVGGSPLASHLIHSQGPVGIGGTGGGTRTSYISNSAAASIYYTDGGASYPFNDFGNLVIQPRTSAARSVVIATGSTTPVERAVVKSTGQVRFVPLASDPAGAEAGDVYYNSTSNKLKCYNGTTWNDLF